MWKWIRKRTVTLGILLAVVQSTAWGSLRTLGTMGEVGLLDSNALHLVVVLTNSTWGGLISRDGGRSWRIAEPGELTGKPAPLPADGDVRYHVVGREGLCRSDDSGATWSDASPWSSLRRKINEDVQAEQQAFQVRYRHWLPDDEDWWLVFGSTALLLTGLGTWRARKFRRDWLAPTAQSLAAYCLMGVGLFAAHQFEIGYLAQEQWAYRVGHGDGGVNWPLWPLGWFLHLTGNDWLAPITAAVCFSLTALWSGVRASQSDTGHGRLGTLVATVPACALTVLLILSFVPGVGRGWSNNLPAFEEDPAVNVTNSTPAILPPSPGGVTSPPR